MKLYLRKTTDSQSIIELFFGVNEFLKRVIVIILTVLCIFLVDRLA